MRVIVTSTYSGKQRVFEGDPSSVYLQLVARYPFLESYEEGHHGNLVSLLEYLNSMQAYDAYVEGAEELEQEDIDDELSELGLEDDELGKSLSNVPLYLEYEDLEKGERLPHYLKFMGNHPKAQETAEWSEGNLNHRGLAEFAMRHAKTKPEGLSDEEKTTIKHFGDSLHMPEVQKAAGQLNNKHNFETGIQLLQNAQDEYSKRHAASAPKLTPVEGKKLLDLGDGVAVYNLGKGKNKNEATAMGHCATPHSGGELWSIRRNHGNGMVEPLVTLSHEDGYIGEVKGKYNWKPSEKHHPYIAKLMASDLVKGFVGGGYAPESNFEFSDMKDGLRRKLLEYKPALTAKVYKELLPEGFQGGYNHVPEVKSIFSSNDAKAQIEFLKKHKPRSLVHQNAAHNPNTSQEALHHLVTVNEPGSGVHANAAKNPKISQELLHHLVTTNKPDSWVHRYAAENPDISQELLHHLVTTNKPDSWVHHNAVQNPKISQELLHHLVTTNKPDSDVHYLAAQNPKISQELLHHLVTVNEPGSLVHHNAAKNPNISQETLHHLVTTNEPGSGVHANAAKNPKISQELLHHLVTTNKPDSWVHRYAAENPNISQETLHHLVTVNELGSIVHQNAANNPQFSKLPLETQKMVRPLIGENIQKIISMINDENNPEQAKIAQRELLARRKARYDKILSPEGNLEELQHLAESHDEDISQRARAELKRRGLSKSEDDELELQKSDWGTPLFQTHDWKYLGSGHQGHVYQASPEAVVKVSKTTPFNKMNPLKTPLQARNDVMDEHDSISGMQGHPLAPKHYGTWRKGSKVYLAREALTPIKDGELNESDLDYVREQMYDAFKSGYMPIDRIQLGRNSQGQIKIMDMGGMKKRTSNSSTVANWDKQDLTGHLRYLFSKHGQDPKSHKYIPTEFLQEEVGRFSKLSDFLGSKQEFVDWKNSRTNELARRTKATESPVTKSDFSYRIEHTAPTSDGGAPLHNLQGHYPDDIYGVEGAQLYGNGFKYDYSAIGLIQQAKNKPNMKVRIYRAVPKTKTNAEKIQELEQHKKHILKTGTLPQKAWPNPNGGQWKNSSAYYDFAYDQINHLKTLPDEEPSQKMKINPGDWVSISKEYAKEHGESVHGNGNYQILSMSVPAAHVWTDANSIHEWGYDPQHPVTKSENIYPNLLNSDRDSVLEVARYMLGFQQNSHDIFEAARFLVAGQTVSLDRIRRAIYETDGDVELAALKAYGLEANESNLKALRAVLRTQNLSKSSQLVQVREAVPALPEGYDAADAIKRAADSGNLTHIKLHGKHSVGSLLAMDPEEERFYLLKPNFGGPGPAAGAQEEKATPAKREAAFSHVAQEWGLSKWIPHTDLVLLDDKEFAAIHVLPWSWKGLEKLREQNPSKLLQMLNRYLAAGTLHRWAVLDFVLGNTDRHGQNMMGDFETEELALIDHGSTMAGPSFDPAHDENSFVPFYLRVMTRGDFNSLDAQEKLKRMPTVGTDVNEQLMQWLMSLDAHELEDILYRYGINPAPALQRLKAIREKVAESGRVDKTINALWVMT